MRGEYSFTRLLATIVGAIVFTALWFWLTLKALDYWDAYRQKTQVLGAAGARVPTAQGTSASPVFATSDAVGNQWIDQKRITSKADTLAFKPVSEKTRIVIFNDESRPLAATVSRIVVSGT